jgi:hypothetical protein
LRTLKLKQKKITFYSYTARGSVTPIKKLYDDFKNEELNIRFGAGYGRYPINPISEK